MQEILINGVTCIIKRTGQVQHGLEMFWAWGMALNGRKCLVGHHFLPPHVLDNGGKASIWGNTYEIQKG